MAGIEGHHAVLDRGTDSGAVRADDTEAAMKYRRFRQDRPRRRHRQDLVRAPPTCCAAQGATVRLSDSKPAAGQSCRRRSRPFTAVDLIVLVPGVPADIPEVLAAKQRGIPVIGEVELASYWLRGPVLGITGSNGKTTTTAMTGHILRKAGVACQVGGNIGTAPTSHGR